MSGVRTPSFRLSRTMTRTVPPSRRKGAFVELGPDLRARAPHQQPHRLARAVQGQDEEPRASVLPRTSVADHRTAVAVVNLAFFAGCGRDDHARLGRRRARSLTTKRRTLAYRFVCRPELDIVRARTNDPELQEPRVFRIIRPESAPEPLLVRVDEPPDWRAFVMVYERNLVMLPRAGDLEFYKRLAARPSSEFNMSGQTYSFPKRAYFCADLVSRPSEDADENEKES
jgi:hypothetical protein